MAALVTHDAVAHPAKGARPPKKQVELEDFSRDELSHADELLAAEVAAFEAAAGSELANGVAFQATLEEGLGHLTYLPQAKRYVEWRMISKGDRLEAAKHMYELSEAQVQRDSKRAKKLEDKLERVLGGYNAKSRQSVQKSGQLAEERDTITVETEVFTMLRAREEKAIESRIQELQEAVTQEKTRNSSLQLRYKELKQLRDKIEDKLQ